MKKQEDEEDISSATSRRSRAMRIKRLPSTVIERERAAAGWHSLTYVYTCTYILTRVQHTFGYICIYISRIVALPDTYREMCERETLRKSRVRPQMPIVREKEKKRDVKTAYNKTRENKRIDQNKIRKKYRN